MTTGRPHGKAHPMPMLEFWRLFLEQLPLQPTVRDAYEAAEIIVFGRYERRRFGSYQSFKKAKCLYYKSKSKKTWKEL